MAYESIERLFSRRGEKVGPFLTVENAVGVAVCAGPIMLISDLSLWWRAGLMLLAAILGLLLTMDTNGMLFCERVLWRVRGEIRLLLHGRTITPEHVPGTRAAIPVHRAVSESGIVRKARPMERYKESRVN